MTRHTSARNRRQRLLDEDDRCRYCRRPLTIETSTLDRIRPRSRGGTNEPHNFTLACYRCNHRKAGYLPQELREWVNRIVDVADGI